MDDPVAISIFREFGIRKRALKKIINENFI